jgi:hypothetical protein
VGTGLRKLARPGAYLAGLSYLRRADLHVGLPFNLNVGALAAGGWKRVLRRE